MLVIVGHGLYVLCVEQFDLEQLSLKQFGQEKFSLKKFSLGPTQKFLRYLIVSAIAGIAYLPWIIFSDRFPTDISQLDWMDQPPGLLKMGSSVVGVLGRSFVDFGVTKIGSSAVMLLVVPLLLLSMGICLLAVVCLVRQTPFRVWFFVATLGGVTAAVVLGSYFVLDKAVATTRFMLPISLSLQLAVAYFLVTGIEHTTTLLKKHFRRSTWQAVAYRTLGSTLLSVGVISCVLRLNAPLWWTQMPDLNRSIPAIAQFIDQQDNPLIILDGSKDVTFFTLVQSQSLLHSVAPNTQMQMQLVDKVVPNLTQLSAENIFICLPFKFSGPADSPASLQAQMASRYKATLEPVVPGTFWHVSQSN